MSFKMDPGVHGASGGCHLRRQRDHLAILRRLSAVAKKTTRLSSIRFPPDQATHVSPVRRYCAFTGESF